MQNLPSSEVVLIVANTLAFVGAVAGVFVAGATFAYALRRRERNEG
jgi:hypothetical protein